MSKPILKALLVEDDPDVAAACSALLDYLGYHVMVATNGQDGLHFILHEHPDVVITDFMMPLMTGLEMIERAREAQHEGLIVLCSAMPASSLPTHEARYDVFLQKPYGLGDLIATLAAPVSPNI